MIHTVIDSGCNEEIDAIVMERAAQETLRQQSAPDADLTLVLTDDKAIRKLNRDFLGNNSPTDVLSFPASETDPETGRRYLGDVVISLPRARQQAEAVEHLVQAEVQLLIIHGVLHLLGHDHAEAEEKARMWAAQTQILEQLGLGNIQIKE
jgi:probable rRNA maturation factor